MELTAQQKIERLFYEHGWTVFWPPPRDDRFTAADLEALAAEGKLEWRGDVVCIEGHVVWGGARSADEANANRGRECTVCLPEERSDDPDDYTVDVRYVMSEAWVEALGGEIPGCARCGGSGREPVVFCDECGKRADADGYCDACATAAVERYKAAHGGRSPADEVEIRKTERAQALEELVAAAARAWTERSGDSMLLLGNALLRYRALAPEGGR